MKNILHISDIHLSDMPSLGFQPEKLTEILNKLFSDINSQNIVIDTVFITGDIAFSGKKEQFELAKDILISKISHSLKIEIDRIMIAPGNHDIDRESISFLERDARDKGRSYIESLYQEITSKQLDWKRTDNFFEFANTIQEREPNCFWPFFSIKEVGATNIISINSAWLAQDNYDKGKLSLIDPLKDALSKAKIKGKQNVLLAHHPLDWISEEELNDVSTIIEKNISAFLFGHMHQFEQSVTISFSEDITLKLQAGTLDSRSSVCGYSIIELEERNNFTSGRVIYRKYGESSFQPWETTKNQSGIYNFNTAKNTIFDPNKFSEKCQDIINSENQNHISNLGSNLKTNLEDIFIKPSFKKTLDSETSFKEIEGFDEIREQKLCFILGPERLGKTTLLKYLWIQDLKKHKIIGTQDISFYLDLSDLDKASEGKILSELISIYNGKDLGTSFDAKIRTSINAGNAFFYFDNIDRADEKTKKSICSFINNNQKNHFFISANESYHTEIINNKLIRSDLISATATLSHLKRKDIRQIISCRPHLYESQSKNEVLNSLIKIIDESYLSHNHFVYSILLSIFENKKSLLPGISESDVIENYIEILLYKHNQTPDPNKPRFNDIKHFCAFISSEMLNRREKILDEFSIYDLINKFNQETLNSYNSIDYLKPLLESEIIKKDKGELYSFSNNCFFDYFLAFHANKSIDTKDTVFNKEHFLNLDKTIEYFASQNSSSFEAFDFVLSEIKNTRKKYKKKYMNHHL